MYFGNEGKRSYTILCQAIRDWFEMKPFRLLAVWYQSTGLPWCLCQSSLWDKNPKVQGDVCLFKGKLFLDLWSDEGKNGGGSEKKILHYLASLSLSPKIKVYLWVRPRGPIKSSQKSLLASAVQMTLIKPWVRASWKDLVVPTLQALTVFCFALM